VANKKCLKLLTVLGELGLDRFAIFELNPLKMGFFVVGFSIFMSESQNKRFVNNVWRGMAV
jgi:hypothetical protein